MQQELFNSALARVGFPPREHLAKKKILLGSEIEKAGDFLKSARAPLPEKSLQKYYVQYRPHELVPFTDEALQKPFLRFDFQEEWNNRGYGRITLDPTSPFSCAFAYNLRSTLETKIEILAEVFDQDSGHKISDFAALIHTSQEVLLWFNRGVGPIDGYDWVVVENFLSTYKASTYGAYPCVSEIPTSFHGAVTMRIDCDEAVVSGRPLFELYKKYNRPFSMAIKTQQNLGADDVSLMNDVIAAGGSVMGHSHTHAPDWGGSSEKSQWEMEESRRQLKILDVDKINYDYAVSPFHQNSRRAIEGLRAASLKAFVGGIICNDPEYLMARAGQVPHVPGVISHSEQCMLHGETYHQHGNKIDVEKLAFRQALQSRTFFGYLDHPFSQYHYGWDSEEERLHVHEEFIKYISSFEKIWSPSLAEALRFFEMKASIQVSETAPGKFQVSLPQNPRFADLPKVRVDFANKEYALALGETLDLA